jgi:hypothetical protein
VGTEIAGLVQEQDSSVCPADGARAGQAAAAADQGRYRRRVVWRDEWWVRDERGLGGQHTRYRVHCGGFQGLLRRQGRQQAGKALGQHGFAGAGRAGEQ